MTVLLTLLVILYFVDKYYLYKIFIEPNQDQLVWTKLILLFIPFSIFIMWFIGATQEDFEKLMNELSEKIATVLNNINRWLP